MTLIYEPAEDSFLFMDFLRDYFETSEVSKMNVLDMGCGSCVLSETLIDLGFKNILSVDINSDAVDLAKSKGFRAIESDLFEKIDSKFDLICFNAPYLPNDDREDDESKLATSGGERGDEIAVRFLESVNNFIKEDAKIYMLVSSLTPMDKINEYNPEIVARKNIFFEELLVLSFKNL